MEVILFLIPVVIIYGVLIVFPILIAYIAFKIGQLIDLTAGIFAFQWIAPVIVIGIPAAWVFAGYKVFQEQCASVRPPSFVSFPKSRPDGFLLEEKGITQNPYHRICFIYEYKKQLPFEYFEHGTQPFVSRCFSNGKSQIVSQVTSEYALVFMPPKRVEYWWNPPIYLSEMVVIERSSQKILATASDLLFGGGIIGLYLSLPKMSNDYRYISFGFASREVGLWRPKDNHNPRFNQYLRADADFISKALTPVVQTGEN
ncbi:MAG: hypothetical protein WCT30_00720 [Desulfurivibrionaceae bacterium]|jgi:hypothetical protein